MKFVCPQPLYLVTALALAFSGSASAAPMDPADADYQILRQQLAEQAKSLAEQQGRLAQEMKKLEAAQRRIESMQTQLGVPVEAQPERVSQAEQSTFRGRGSAERVDTSLDVATVFAQPSILTQPGTFVFEPSLQYSFSSSNRVSVIGFSVLNAVIIGGFDISSARRSTWVGSLGGRYGLTDRLEVEARIPFLYRTDDTLTRDFNVVPSVSETLFGAEGKGLGDIEVAGRYQLNRPKGDDPFYIAGLRFKTRTGKDQFEIPVPLGNPPSELPTGSGFYSLQPSLSAVLPADPAVFFGGINYILNIKRDVGGTVGEVDPGDSVGLNFGMGLSLNEKSSFSLGYEHTWVDKTTQNGSTSSTAMAVQLGTLQAGYAYRLSKRTNLSLSIGAGLTEDTPDTTVTLRVPIKF